MPINKSIDDLVPTFVFFYCSLEVILAYGLTSLPRSFEAQMKGGGRGGRGTKGGGWGVGRMSKNK